MKSGNRASGTICVYKKCDFSFNFNLFDKEIHLINVLYKKYSFFNPKIHIKRNRKEIPQKNRKKEKSRKKKKMKKKNEKKRTEINKDEHKRFLSPSTTLCS